MIAIMSLIPVRPDELVRLKKEDLQLIRDTATDLPCCIKLSIETRKKKGNKFFPKRHFDFVYGDIPDVFFKSIWKYVSQIKTEDSRVFPISKRQIRYMIDRLGMRVLGRHLCPYVFRHSTLTRYANEGKGIDELMYLKGASDISSISPYIHGREQRIKF